MMESTGGPPNNDREDELVASIRHLDAQLTQLLGQTNQLLQGLLAVMQTGAAPQTIRTASTVPVETDWGSRWAGLVNRAFEAEDVKGVQNALMVALARMGEKPLRVDFDDAGEFQQNRNYAIFSENQAGCCFLVKDPNTEDRYLALPYPTSPTWFLQYGWSIRVLYNVQGAGSASAAPKLRVLRSAVLRRTDEVNARGNTIFKPFEKGEMIAS